MVATVPLLVSDDVDAAADALRPFYALYFGGMGAKGRNFHANVAIRMGHGDMVEKKHTRLEEATDKTTSEIVNLLNSNTSLTQQDKDLTEEVAKLTKEIHALLTQRAAS